MSNKPDTKFPKTYAESKIIRRLTMRAPDPASEARERAELTFAEKGYNIEALVWLRSGNNRAPIRANMNITQVLLLTNGIAEIADNPAKDHFDLPIGYPAPLEPGVPYDRNMVREILDQAVVRVAKNSEGLVSIGIFDKRDDERSRILFPYQLDQFTKFVHKNGNHLTEAEVSCMVAKNSAKMLETVALRIMEVTSNEKNAENYSGGDKKPAPQRTQQSGDSNKDFQDISY